jgi:hypothetical protein
MNNKNKHYFLKMAILKTMASGLVYLMMPVAAKAYHSYMGGEYIGYTIFGSAVMIIGNIILLVRAWTFALDKGEREKFLSND